MARIIDVVARFLLSIVLLTLPASAASWTEYRTGPFHVISNARDREARERLAEMEQLRHALGAVLGKDNLDIVWPIDLVVFANQREYGPHALPQPMVDGGSATLAAWMGEVPLPRDFLRQLTRLLIEDNAGRMPEATETALCDLFSTIQVNGVRVFVGAPLGSGELTSSRLAAWAKLQMLATQPEYSTKLRVYLNNLQQSTDENVAAHNAYDIDRSRAEPPRGSVPARGNLRRGADLVPSPSIPVAIFWRSHSLNPLINDLLAELKIGRQRLSSGERRADFLARATNRPTTRLAADANPRWAEPHAQLADLETEPVVRIKRAEDGRDARTAQRRLLAGAGGGAGRRETVRGRRQVLESGRAQCRQRSGNARRIHQTRLRHGRTQRPRSKSRKGSASRKSASRTFNVSRTARSAEIHAAEDAANKQMGGLKPGETVVPWWTEVDRDKR